MAASRSRSLDGPASLATLLGGIAVTGQLPSLRSIRQAGPRRGGQDGRNSTSIATPPPFGPGRRRYGESLRECRLNLVLGSFSASGPCDFAPRPPCRSEERRVG